MKRLARLIPIAPDRLQTISAVDEDQIFGVLSRGWLQICRCAAALTSARRLLAAVLFWQKKGGAVGRTKCGKGSRIMAIADASGFPVAACLANASPHEVKFAEAAIDSMFVSGTPEKLIGDKKTYDSDTLDGNFMEKYGADPTAPHHRNRTKANTHDERKLMRYKRRWKIERLFAWLQNFRRLVVRPER